MDLDALTADVLTRCDILARHSEEPCRLTRTFLRPPARLVHDHLTAWMCEAGLTVRTDALGNLIGRRSAFREDARVFAVGSHTDTVPNAGKYDGVLGVLLAIAAAQRLPRRDFIHTLDIIAFSEEEGVRFATPYLGSRAICGRFNPALLTRTDKDGVTMAQALRDFGLDPVSIPAAAYPAGQLAGYLEVHIEQGPVLESLDLSLGIVEAIVGQSRRWLTFTGRAGHAGTQPMELRRDALVAAAEFVSVVERTGRDVPGLRATVGSLTVAPGAVNVVPGLVGLSLDVRHGDDAVRERSIGALIARAHTIGAGRGVAVEDEVIADQAAVPCDRQLTGRLAGAVVSVGHRPHRLVSGAGHDTVVMAEVCPVAMLFLRSPGGVSHHPDEAVRPEDVRAALDATVRFLSDVLGDA